MHLLPNHLGPLAQLCAGSEHGRYASTTGVKIDLAEITDAGPGNGPVFTATATDGRRAIKVSGPCEVSADYPSFPALDSAPNGIYSAVVPAKDWKEAFTSCLKITKRAHKPILQSLACVIGKDICTFGAHDLEKTYLSQPRTVEGRFPNVDQVIPPANKALISFGVDPFLLAETLTVAGKIGTDDECKRVTIELHAPHNSRIVSLIAIRAEGTKYKVTGAVVPLCGPKADKNEDMEEVSAEQHRADLQRELTAHRQTANELDAAQQTIENMRAALESIRDTLAPYATNSGYSIAQACHARAVEGLAK